MSLMCPVASERGVALTQRWGRGLARQAGRGTQMRRTEGLIVPWGFIRRLMEWCGRAREAVRGRNA